MRTEHVISKNKHIDKFESSNNPKTYDRQEFSSNNYQINNDLAQSLALSQKNELNDFAESKTFRN